jgi:hypothetical protein
MSLLSIVQEAAGSLNQPVPNVVVGNTTGDSLLWFNLAQREGRELFRRHDWQVLIVQHTWTTTATQAQASALPSAYDRLPPDPEIWNRTTNSRYIGPTTSRDWQILNSTSVSGGNPGWWRIIGGVLNLYPAPSAGDTATLEYISSNWATNAGGVPQSAWVLDSDLPIIPSRLFVMGIIWRWLRAKGFDYAEEMSTYERELERAAARDRGSNIMVVGGPRGDETSTTWDGTII